MSNALCKNAIPPNYSSNEDYSITFRADGYGHFMINVLISGKYTEFMFDTGASQVALTYKDAQRLGIDVDGLLYTDPVETAKGTSYVAPIILDSITIGPITVKKVRAHVSKDNKSSSLLGMTFIGQLKKHVIEGECLTMWGKDGAPQKKEEEVKPPKAPNASQRKPTPTKPSTDNECVRDLKKATDRVQEAQRAIDVSKARIAVSPKVKNRAADLKLCEATLSQEKEPLIACGSSYKDIMDKAAECQKKMPKQQANTYKLITEVVDGLNKAFAKKQCAGLKHPRTLAFYPKATGATEDVVVTKEGKLAFVGEKLFPNELCNTSLKEAVAKAGELEKRAVALEAEASTVDPNKRLLKLAECKADIEAAKEGFKTCNSEGKSSAACSKNLQGYLALEKNFVVSINELVGGKCTLTPQTELGSNENVRMLVGANGKVVLTGVGHDGSDEL